MPLVPTPILLDRLATICIQRGWPEGLWAAGLEVIHRNRNELVYLSKCIPGDMELGEAPVVEVSVQNEEV